jgi:hypothetical protein
MVFVLFVKKDVKCTALVFRHCRDLNISNLTKSWALSFLSNLYKKRTVRPVSSHRILTYFLTTVAILEIFTDKNCVMNTLYNGSNLKRVHSPFCLAHLKYVDH